MITSPNLYAGKTRGAIVSAAVYGGSTVTAGLWNIVPTMLSKYVYQTLNFADTLTVGNFCSPASNTASTLSDVNIDLLNFKSDFLICKDNFRGTFNENNPLPAIDAYVNKSMEFYSRQMENLRWAGSTVSTITALQPQNG